MSVPSEFVYEGPNKELVREVFEFAFSTEIVSAVGPDEESSNLIITTDLVRAVDAAGMRSVESRFIVGFGERMLVPETWPCDGQVNWSDEEGWGGLRENLVAHYIQTSDWYLWSKNHKTEIDKCKSMAVQRTADDPMHLQNHLRTLLPEGPIGPNGCGEYYRLYVINEIASDMMQCAKNRAFNGLVDNFWERLLTLYRRGVWPCCWLGRWPDNGRILAWRRAE